MGNMTNVTGRDAPPRSECCQFLVYGIHWQAHDIGIGPFDLPDFAQSDPLLDGIGPGFVPGLVMIQVVPDLIHVECIKKDPGNGGEDPFFGPGEQAARNGATSFTGRSAG